MAALDAIADRAINGRGGVVNVVGPPGIGKSRTARETAALATARGVDVYWAFCESHASDIPFQVMTRLLGASTGVADLDGDAARVQVRAQFPDADPRICCCSTICWASPTPICRCPRSILMRGGGG